jgi:hypothetical protein
MPDISQSIVGLCTLQLDVPLLTLPFTGVLSNEEKQLIWAWGVRISGEKTGRVGAPSRWGPDSSFLTAL